MARREGPQRLLAVSSSGGHWTQLLRLRPAFEGRDVFYVTTGACSGGHSEDGRIFVVRDICRTDAFKLPLLVMELIAIFRKVRPTAVITTGAAPGAIALVIGKLMGARTVWIDSIANAEDLSMSGKWVRRWADLWLTQWPDVAGRYERLAYRGAVI